MFVRGGKPAQVGATRGAPCLLPETGSLNTESATTLVSPTPTLLKSKNAILSTSSPPARSSDRGRAEMSIHDRLSVVVRLSFYSMGMSEIWLREVDRVRSGS